MAEAEVVEAAESRQAFAPFNFAFIIFLVLILLLLGTWGGQLFGI